jgi:nucleotide-binding universal stress UspA family protein
MKAVRRYADMLPIRTILCAIDFSADSRQALRTALAIVSHHPAHIVALHVIDLALAHAAAAAKMGEGLKAETASALRRFVEAEVRRSAVDPTLSVEVRVGLPEREVLARARDCRADLIVTGTCGLSGATKVFFGSVAEKILRRAEVPVLLVPAAEEEGEPLLLSRVLAAVDLDDTIEHGVSQAADVAQHLDLPLRLIHAVSPLPADWRWLDALQASTPIRVRRARERLDEIARTLRVFAETDVRVGSTAEQVTAAANEQPGTLLVVGLDGGTPLGRVGSTAYRIVCLSKTPVLALPIHIAASAEGMELAAAEAT